MRVLLLGPTGDGGSIPPYLNVLTAALNHHGVDIDRLGSAGVPYDTELQALWPTDRLLAAAADLNDRLRTRLQAGSGYDLIALHHGNLEIEQLLPLLWSRNGTEGLTLPPVVHHAHTLQATLFRDHRREADLHHAVQTSLSAAAGLVCFGGYARTTLADRLPSGAPIAVCPLPTTIPPATAPAASLQLAAALGDLDAAGRGPLATLYGYAAPWKDPATLLTALDRVTHPLRVLLAGPLWDHPDHAGTVLPAIEATTAIGKARLRVLPTYFTAPDRAALIAASDVAVFCYQPHAAFQGSGAIADYLAAAVPIIATDVANMAELTGHTIGDPAGDLVAACDPDALAAVLDRYSDPRHCGARTTAARRRAHLFTPAAHARGCLDLYHRVLGRCT